MIFLSVALYREAKPFIDRFCLKKNRSINKFQVFESEDKDIALIITGTGGINTACACTYLISKFDANRYDTFINIGICGSRKKEIKIGTVILANKIINGENNNVFYPDVLFKHPFLEGSVESFSKVVEDNYNVEGEFTDMEGAAFFQTISIFLPPHRIISIKVVSDYLDGAKFNKDSVEYLMRMNVVSISGWIENIKSQSAKPKSILSEKDMDYISEIISNLKLSIYMQNELKKLSENYKLRNNNLILALEPFTQVYSKSKSEGKIYFEQLRKQLNTV